MNNPVMMHKRAYDLTDQLILRVDRLLGRLVPAREVSGRPTPSAPSSEASTAESATANEKPLTAGERQHIAGLMRINHAGEVAAQGLYHGQASVARQPAIRDSLLQSAREEGDHLAWCAERLHSLNSHTSYLNPAWYGGSFALGALVGLCGDKWSLGFVVETERQVEAHLDEHLALLPAHDVKSRAILEQIKQDEAHHAATAAHAGGEELPTIIKRAMTLCARLMTRSAYYV